MKRGDVVTAATIGRLNETDLSRLNIALAFALGLSD
jgi:hypothetical protein